MASDTCTCGRIKIGLEVTDARNWNPDCTEHGANSEWWNSPEQVAKRDEQRMTLLVLYAKGRAARKLGHGCSTGEVLEPIGECGVCDLARVEFDGRNAT